MSDNFEPPKRAYGLRDDSQNANFDPQNEGDNIPIPLTDEEYSRLLLIYGYGDELATSPNQTDIPVNSLDTPLNESVRAKMYLPIVIDRYVAG